MTKYKNLSKAELEDKELQELEAEYKKQYGEEQPIAEEDDTLVPVVNKEEQTWKERYANLKSYADKNKNEAVKEINDLKARLVELEKKPSGVPVNANLDEAKRWVENYPDLAATLKTLWKQDIEYLKEEIGPKLTELEATKHEIARERAYATVCKAHSDFPELVNDQDFIEWVQRQPEEKGVIGKAIYSALHENETDADAAIKAVNIYKQEKSFSTTPKRNPAREAVQAVRKTDSSSPSDDGGKRTFSESQVDKMSIREYEKFEDQIDEAKRENRFVYDLSGAAR